MCVCPWKYVAEFEQNLIRSCCRYYKNINNSNLYHLKLTPPPHVIQIRKMEKRLSFYERTTCCFICMFGRIVKYAKAERGNH